MDRRQVSVLLVLDVLGVSPILSTFEDRLIIQKTIYLAQTCGVNLGYSFRWSMHGPYSRDLTYDVFTAVEADQAPTVLKRFELDQERKKRLEPAAKIIRELTDDTRANRMELLTSVHFLCERRAVSPVDLPERLRKSDADVHWACHTLQEIQN